MSADLPPILVVDDEPNMRDSVKEILNSEGYLVTLAESAEVALEKLSVEGAKFLMTITDARMGGMNGYQLLERISKDWPSTPVIIITAFATPKLAVEAIQSGALDYLAKPFAPEELLHAVDRCRERYELLFENASLRAQTTGEYEINDIVGNCAKIGEMRDLIKTVAPTDATVLILGESGTGKELIAGAIHRSSSRCDNKYVRLNCAAIPEALLESELFGHEKGAFTGALRQKPGRVEEADGGTIFLDEIGDMSRPLQAKLLRFLEDGTFNRVGGNEELKVNVRVIAATNRNIVEAIKDNEFREDLFHRLNVMQFRPTPLRERGDDILMLSDHFLEQHCSTLNRQKLNLSKGAEKKLLSHKWPGNVRELRNVIERAVILTCGKQVETAALPDFELETQLRDSGGSMDLAPDSSIDDALAEYEKSLITAALESNNFNMNRTAEDLKTTRHSLRYRMQRLEMTPANNKDNGGD